MKAYKVTVEYDGGPFSGWQVQPRQRTVQGDIEKALETLTLQKIKIHASGRTDTGVHANGQVFHMHVDTPMTRDALFNGLNALMPVEIAILEMEPVALNFDARKTAKRKTYDYRFYQSPFSRAFLEPYALRLRKGVDLAKMQEASQRFIGTHDFKAYQATGSTATSTVRTIYSVTWHEHEDYVTMRVTGNGFLYHMVRNMVGILLFIGRGKLKEDAINESYEHLTRKLLPPTAPAHGLYLKSVDYDEEIVDTRGEVV